MLEEFIDHWWLALTRGILVLLFGLVALLLANNMSTLITQILFRVSIVVLFAFYLGLSGSLTLLGAYLIRHPAHRWIYIAHGFLLAGLCVALFAAPNIRLESLILLTAAHAALNGIWELRIANALRNHRADSLLLLALACISLVTAALLLIQRNGPASAMTTLLGAYACVYGLFLTYFGLHMRRKNVP